MRGKLIVIEGTDCSGKETQSNGLVEFLNQNGYPTKKYAFPNYDSPTGKIIAGPFLGKEGYLPPLFSEGASKVDPYCSCLLYAMDRKYNIPKIQEDLDLGFNIVLDRYIESNMAHQGSKLPIEKQEEMFKFIEDLEYGLLKLPKSDLMVFLHMPVWAGNILKSGRKEKPDQNEMDIDYLVKSEETYLKLAKRNNALTIECTDGDRILSKEEIGNVLKEQILMYLKKIKS